MTSPGYQPRHYSPAGIIDAARRGPLPGVVLPSPHVPRPERPPLTDSDRRALMEAIQAGNLCRCCAGIHAGGELACPRLATFEVDADGRLRAGSYWPDSQWDASRVVFAEEGASDDAAS